MAVVLSKKFNAVAGRYRQRPSGLSGITAGYVVLLRQATSLPPSHALPTKIPESQRRLGLDQRFLKIAGSLYLLYLAYKIATTSRVDDVETRKPLTFFEAMVFQWLNPKAWVVAIGALAAFTEVGKFTVQFFRLFFTFLTVGSACLMVWMCFGVLLNRVIHEDKKLRLFNLAMGLLLSASVVPMLFSDSIVIQ